MARNDRVYSINENISENLSFLNYENPTFSPNGTIFKNVNVKCICGKTKVIRLSSILSGLTKSCGCIRFRSPNLTIGYILKNIKVDGKGCWIWQGSLYGVEDYGQASFKGKDGRSTQVQAHRASWIAHNGEVPDKLWVLHKCNIKSCCNPEHLYLGTPSDNGKDRWANPNNANERDRLREAIRNGVLKPHFENGRKIGQPRATKAAAIKNTKD